MLKWGIIGTGNIAAAMVKDFKFVEEGKLISVVGTSIEKGKAFAKKHHIEKTFSRVEEFLQDPALDCVYVATPHNEHKGLVIQALRAGKHVLCEKPMGINRLEEEEMLDVARQEGCFLMEAFWTAYLPAVMEAEKWIEDGEIGSVRLIEGDFSFRLEEEKGRLFDPDRAGGALLDVGIYVIGMAHRISQIIGSGPLVSTHIAVQKTGTGVDGQDTIILQYKNGLTASLTCAISLEGDKVFKVHGDKGYIEIPEFFRAKKAYLYTRNDRLDYKSSTPAEGYVYEVNFMNKAIKTGNRSSHVLPVEDSMDFISIIDELRSLIGLKYPME